MKQTKGKIRASTTFRALGLLVGAAIGFVLGALFGNPANGTAFGITLGLGLGTLLDIRSKRNDSNPPTKPSDVEPPESEV